MLKKNLVANYLGQGWSTLISVVLIPQYIRYVGIEAYGLIGFFTVLQAWFSILDMGLTPALNREMAAFRGGATKIEAIRGLLRSIEFVFLLLGAAIVLAVWASAGWFSSNWFNSQSLPPITIMHSVFLMGAIVASRLVENIYRSALFGLQLQVKYNIYNSMLATLRAVGALLVLAAWSPTIQAYFLWQLASSLVAVLVLAWLTYRHLPATIAKTTVSLKHLARIRSFAGGVLGITLTGIILTQLDKVYLSRALYLEQYGYYSLAVVVASVLYMISGPIVQAVFPHMSELRERQAEKLLIDSYHKSSQLLSVLLGTASAILILFAEEILYIWTGDPGLVENAAGIVRILVIGNLLNGLMSIPYHAQLAYGWTSLAIKSNLVALVFIVPLLTYMVPRYGVTGAAWVWVFLNAGYLVFTVHFMHRRIIIFEKWRWYVRDLLMPLLAIFLCVFLLGLFARPSGPVLIQVSVILCYMACAILAGLLSAPGLRDRLLGDVLSR